MKHIPNNNTKLVLNNFSSKYLVLIEANISLGTQVYKNHSLGLLLLIVGGWLDVFSILLLKS